MKTLKTYFYIFIVLVLYTSCTSGESNNKPTIAVTIEPLRYFTEQIAGENYHVISMIPNGNNPETYEPTSRQMVDIGKSYLYIKVGQLGFEQTWVNKIQQNIPQMSVIDSSIGIEDAQSSNIQKDPHTWMSGRNAHIIAQNIYQALARTFPKDRLLFRKRLHILQQTITETDDSIKRIFATKEQDVPISFCIYHPALTYFAREYKLNQLAIEDDGKEPSAQQLYQLIEQVKQQQVHIIFVQKEFSNRNIATIIKETSTKAVTINPLSHDWPNEMLKIANILKE